MSEDIVSRAKALAIRAHAGQVDKAGRPYIEHVSRVAARVSGYPVTEAVAWLHDVAEDSEAFVDELVDTFPEYIWQTVAHLTRLKGVSDGAYYALIRSDWAALQVKLADIADNSDEERLALLDAKTANRLRKKYKAALEALTG